MKKTIFLLSIAVSFIILYSSVLWGAISPNERAALIQLYIDTNGDGWTNNTGWKTPPLDTEDGFGAKGTENTWFGITCDGFNITVQALNLGNNNLSGTIPTQLGDLSNLQYINFADNQLTGNIPPNLGSLSGLIYIFLGNNRLTGGIPHELGNLSNLQGLYLQGNALSGIIPSTFINLTALQFISISYNALYTDDENLFTLLNDLEPGWADFQTVAPLDLSVQALSWTSVRLTWTPIPYQYNTTGGYLAFYSTQIDGEYEYAGITADKAASQFDITGLNQGTEYFFTLSPRTDAYSLNQNTVTGGFSPRVSLQLDGPVVDPDPGTDPDPISLLSPQKNDVYNVGTLIPIRWNIVELTGEVEIRLFLADESNSFLLSGNQPADDAFFYEVADNIPKGIYFIEVRQGDLFDRSGNFYIDNQSTVILVASPSGGETFSTGDTIEITWTAVRISGNVALTLVKIDDTVQFISPSRPFDGSPFSFTIPVTVTTGEYYIKIEHGTVSGRSGVFTISGNE